jgi:predicted ArsR family transcriptional regulator
MINLASPASPSTANQPPIRPVDQLVLDLLRREEGLTVNDLTEKLEVTATAVRQRLDRLESAGYLERRKHSSGRGRPTFSYFLTDMGWRQVGVTYTDLAVSLWGEVLSIADPELRSEMIQRVSHRMGRVFRDMLPAGSLDERMRSLASVMASRRIPATFDRTEGLPVLAVHACPYPDLVSFDQNRSLCQLEQQVLSEAIGQPMELSQCKLDGHGCCQFKPATAAIADHTSRPMISKEPVGTAT